MSFHLATGAGLYIRNVAASGIKPCGNIMYNYNIDPQRIFCQNTKIKKKIYCQSKFGSDMMDSYGLLTWDN